jgi:hypothetical protein
LLVVVTVFGVWLGIKVDQARRQKRAVEALRALGAEIAYEHQRVPNGFDRTIELGVPAWARELCGDDFFQTVRAVWFWGKLSADRTETLPRAITDDDLKCLADLPHLEVLHINTAPITDEGLGYLSHPERMIQVTLSDTKIGDGFLRRLREAKRLETLWIDGTGVTDEGLAELRGMTSIKRLSLLDTQTGDRGLAAFTACRNLDVLKPGNKVTNESLRQFENLESLETFTATDSQINGEIFAGLRLPKADEVQLRRCAVADDDLKPLVKALRDVRVLILHGCPVGDPGLRHLAGLAPNGKTQIVILSDTKVQGRELRHLATLRGIQWLSLRGCPLDEPDLKSLEPLYTGLAPGMHLSLDKTSIDDDDLSRISGFTNLTHLTLSDTEITDDGLPHLYALGKLVALDLRGTRVTGSGVYELKQAVGGAVIAWDEDPKPAGWPW